MTDKQKQVQAILQKTVIGGSNQAGVIAKEICQLFEPEPKSELILGCCGRSESQCKCDDVDVASLRLQTRTSSLKPISEQELREKIAKSICDGVSGQTTPDNPNCYLGDADQILTLIKEAGYVRQAKDQTPPPNKYEGDIDIWQNIRLASRQGYALAQQDILAANFRKVEEIND